jgi:hypothetical protein
LICQHEFSRRDFRKANAMKCHPEPAAKDLAAAFFAAAICLVLVALRAPYLRPPASSQIARRATRRARSFDFAQEDTAFSASFILALGLIVALRLTPEPVAAH